MALPDRVTGKLVKFDYRLITIERDGQPDYYPFIMQMIDPAKLRAALGKNINLFLTNDGYVHAVEVAP